MNLTTLSGRYEMIERIGGGGMALVYKAKDTLLNRYVAIKILRQQYVNDDEFLQRFRREAQSAASLSHPNIVSVYDVGQDGDHHFIVMELIEGSNLNEMIKARAPMQSETVVHISTQICDALDHAHTFGIIHRDIKPHNILIGKNGRVKVTDFGIARAITSSTITQTGSVVGSVHYFSPEHAKGGMAGEKSDLYSLGIVMYQMVTAKLPFVGESPISVALKHLQEPVEDPRVINPMIPQSLENIILRALRKKSNERYSTAREMLKDLEMSLTLERKNEPKISFASDHIADDEVTRVIPVLRYDPLPSSANPLPDHLSSNNASSPFKRQDLQVDQEKGDLTKKKKFWIKPVLWLSILGILIGLSWYGIMQLPKLFVVPTVDVPLIEGFPLDSAKTLIEDAGLTIEEPIIYEFNREIPLNYVISQSKAGEKARQRTPIRLVVSKGIELIEMPNLTGKSLEDGTRLLKGLGITDTEFVVETVYDESQAGTIIKQFPDVNEEIDPLETSIRLIVSQGTEEIEMPNLIGLSLIEAQAMLERNGLVLQEKNVIREKAYFQKDKVYKQFPYEPSDPVKPPAQEILIYISDGYPSEAIEKSISVTVSPAVSGEASSIQIYVTDALGEKIEVVNQTITATQIYSFQVVKSPSKNAVIEVFRNNEKIEQFISTYKEETNVETNPSPEQVEEEPAPTPASPEASSLR